MKIDGSRQIQAGTITEDRLSFDPATQAELDTEKTRIDTLESDMANVRQVISGSKRSLGHQTTTLDTLSDVAGLEFDIAANEVWEFSFRLMNGCSSTGGMKFAISIPSGDFWAQATGTIGGFNNFGTSRLSVSSTPTGIAYNTVASTGGTTTVWGTVSCGATGGKVKLQYQSAVSGETSTIYQYSNFSATKIS